MLLLNQGSHSVCGQMLSPAKRVKVHEEMSADIGVIGLAVMGRNLVLNVEDHGFTVAVYNRTTKTTDEFVTGDAKGKKIIGAHTLGEFAAALKRPRRALIMVRAGSPVDEYVSVLVGDGFEALLL
jgi:6-phosphogluconate dehydrogenase